MSQESPAPPSGELQDLLRRWHGGDAAALDQLLARNLPYLRRYARRRLGRRLRSKEQTDDVIQDALVDFMQHGPAFVMESEDHFRNLMKRVVDHVLLGHHEWFSRLRRDLRREHPLPDGTTVVMHPLVASDTSPSQVAEANEHEAMVRLALEMLDPLDCRIVTLRLYKDQSFPDIGVEVGMSDNAVRARFNRAVAKISRKVLALKEGKIDRFLRG